MLVGLFGTCNGSTWREYFKKNLKNNGNEIFDVELFDPIVKEWNKKAQEKEIKIRNTADFVVYVITPKMKGVYSIAEVVDSSNKRPKNTIFCFLKKDDDKKFDESQIHSLTMVGNMIKDNGGKCFDSLGEIVQFLKQNKNIVEWAKYV